MMDRDRLKRKKTLVISKNEYDENSQQVRLIVGCPVVAIRNRKSLKVVNSAVFTVKKLDPLTLKDNLTKSVSSIVLTSLVSFLTTLINSLEEALDIAVCFKVSSILLNSQIV